MVRRLILLAALALVPLDALAKDVPALIETARGLACLAQSPTGEAMAKALAHNARLIDDNPWTLGGRDYGWQRRFDLNNGEGLDITRLGKGDVPRRIDIQYGAQGRPRVIAIVRGADCAIIFGRRLNYDDAGRAETIDELGPDLSPTGEIRLLNPPAPAGVDPGGVTVALIGEGVNYLLADIRDRLAYDEQGKLLGYDYWDMDDRPFDADTARSPFFPVRLGTAVASIILAEAPRARLIPYRYPRPDPARMTALIDDAAANGARIVNLSVGGRAPDPWRAFAAAMADHGEMLFVVSAGSGNRNLDGVPFFPAAFEADNMLVIAAADGFGDPAPPSNWGKGTVDLLVAGENVPVIDFEGRSTVFSGPRFAAPRIAALAARLLAANENWTIRDLKAAIIARARLIDGTGRLTSRYGYLDTTALRK